MYFLVELDAHYQPKQIDPIYKLLGNLNNLSSIFLKAAKTFEDRGKDTEKKDRKKSIVSIPM